MAGDILPAGVFAYFAGMTPPSGNAGIVILMGAGIAGTSAANVVGIPEGGHRAETRNQGQPEPQFNNLENSCESHFDCLHLRNGLQPVGSHIYQETR